MLTPSTAGTLASGGKLAAKLRSPITTTSVQQSNGDSPKPANGEGRSPPPSESPAIDPLSQVRSLGKCLGRYKADYETAANPSANQHLVYYPKAACPEHRVDRSIAHEPKGGKNRC